MLNILLHDFLLLISELKQFSVLIISFNVSFAGLVNFLLSVTFKFEMN